MKYSVLGFNQELVMQTDLDLTDLLLLQYVMGAAGSPNMYHKITDNHEVLVWLSHAKLTEDLPILRISESTLKHKIHALKEKGYLCSEQVANEHSRGTRTYYGITELTTSLIYDTETSRCQNQHLKTRAGAKNGTSDNLLILDNKLDSTIPKGIVSETEPTTKESSSSDELTEYEQHMYSDDRKKSRKVAGEKPKKQNLYEKCMQMIDESAFDDKVKDLLRQYLSVRLAIKDKPIYGANQWKGLLHKLEMLRGDKEQIVLRSLEQGYASFYEINQGYRQSGNPNPSVFGETAEHKASKVTKEDIANGYLSGEKF